MFSPRSNLRALLACGVAASAGAFMLPSASQAAGLSGGSCTPGPATQAFGPWGDFNSYTLVPGGDFEGSLSGWSLAGGAGQVPGSELDGVSGSVGAYSLGLPDSSTAVSPPVCVNVSKPTVELFTRTDTPGASATVSVVYVNHGGNVVVTPLATLQPSATWHPSGPLQLPTVSAPGHPGASGHVSLELSASGGSVQVDDVYIDPWASW